jgi:hypothetical protein
MTLGKTKSCKNHFYPDSCLSNQPYVRYTICMVAPHVVLEIRTSRDNEYKPEATVQLLATLPELQNKPWHYLLGHDERMSFEIVTSNQLTTFQCYVPARLSNYIHSIITASYQEALVNQVSVDPLQVFETYLQNRSPNLKLGSLGLKNQDYFPLKTSKDFSDIDPLVSVLANLSKLEANEQAVIQFVVKNDGDGWKGKGFRQLQTPDHPQKALIEQKLSKTSLRVALRIAVHSDSPDKSQLLLTTISNSFQSLAQSESNALVLKRPYFLSRPFVRAMTRRNYSIFPSMHLTIEELASLYHLPNDKVAHIPNISWGKNLLGEPPENLPLIRPEMTSEEKKEINPFARTLHKNQSTVYGLKRADRRRHLYVIGKTGTGKSTLLANMAINDLKNDEGLCVIDPHGDLVETLLNYIPSRRINDVVYFDPADPERTVKINLFEGKNVVHRELIASGIVSIFQKLYSYSWGPRLEYILRNSLLTLLKSENSRMSDIVDMLTNDKFRAKIVDELDDPILKNFWEMEFNRMQDRAKTEAIAPILNKVGQFVSSPLVRNVVNAHKSSFSVEEIMDEGKILLVNLSQGRLGEDNATLLGAMLITKIQLAAMSRVNTPEEERRDFYLYVDEFQNFATESFNKILSEARKYRLNLTLANQYIAQIPEDVQKAIFGNCGSMISFVMGADDAQFFSKEYGDKYTNEDLVTLSKHQIINKVAIDNVISLPFPAMTLPLAKSSNMNRDKVIKVSRERWATKKGD